MDPVEPRPFRVLGVQQIALGSTDHSKLTPLWCELLGLEQRGRYRSERENVDELILELGVGEKAIELDLMQPIELSRRPKVHEPALHHVGLWVSDLARAVEWLSARGVRFAPGGIRPGAAGHDVCFIHPQPNAHFPIAGQGVLIELVQAPEELLEQDRR